MKLLIIFLFVSGCTYSSAQAGELRVTTMEELTMKRIPFSTIKIYQNDSLILETISDSTGNFRLENLLPGKVNISCEAKHRLMEMKKGVLIGDNMIAFVDFVLKKTKEE